MPEIVTVDLWRWRAEQRHAEVAVLEGYLSAGERARARRFSAAADRETFIIDRGTVRERLASALGGHPATIAIASASAAGGGKPTLAGATHTAMDFNLSHSAGLTILALARSARVGVDIEGPRDLRAAEMASRYCTAEEAAEIAGLPPEARVPAFLRLWTCKEAVVKATGEGLGRPFTSFRIGGFADAPSPTLLRLDGQPPDALRHWRLVAFAPAEGMTGALAVWAARPGVPVALRWRDAPA